MYLAISLRMAGRTKPTLPCNHLLQPHITRLAVHAFDDAGVTVMKRCTFVRPHPGSIFDQETLRQHGQILGRAFKEGEPAGDVWAWFRSQAAAASMIISHNRQHDLAALAVMAARAACHDLVPAAPWFCTASTAAAVLQDSWPIRPNLTLRGAKEARISLDDCRSHFLGGQGPTTNDPLDETLTISRLWRCLHGQRKALS